MKWLFIHIRLSDPENPMLEIVECSTEKLHEVAENYERNVEELFIVPADKTFNFLKEKLGR